MDRLGLGVVGLGEGRSIISAGFPMMNWSPSARPFLMLTYVLVRGSMMASDPTGRPARCYAADDRWTPTSCYSASSTGATSTRSSCGTVR